MPHLPAYLHLAGLAAALPALGLAGVLLFAGLIAVLALVGVVPGALLGMLAGALYGFATGFLAAAAGILAGAIVAFWLGHSLLRPLIAALLGRRARIPALDDIVTQDRWRIVLLLRVCPVLPFSLTSYALGLSGIAFRDYLFGTLAALPPLAGYVLIGALGRQVATSPAHGIAIIHHALLAAGIAGTLALTIHLTRHFSRASGSAQLF